MTSDNEIFKAFLGLLILWAFAYGAFFHGIPALDTWEQVNNYPFGRICDFWNVCK